MNSTNARRTMKSVLFRLKNGPVAAAAGDAASAALRIRR